MLAEPEMISRFSKHRGVTLVSKSLRFNIEGNQISVQIDGYSENPPYLCEAWSGCKRPKAGQKWKVMKDALKLIFIEKMQGGKYKKVLIFSNKDAQKPFVSDKSWLGACLKKFEVETECIKLSGSREKKRRKEAKILRK